MRPGQVAVIALVAAALGGLLALVGANAFDIGGGDTIVFTTPDDEGGNGNGETGQGSLKPLTGNGFDPAEIYRRRSPGVVTIYSFFPQQAAESSDHAAQGSGFVVSTAGPRADERARDHERGRSRAHASG